jgi:hypothetical protein
MMNLANPSLCFIHIARMFPFPWANELLEITQVGQPFTLCAGLCYPELVPLWETASCKHSLQTFQSPVGTLCTTWFNIQKFYVLTILCMYVFCMDHRTNSQWRTEGVVWGVQPPPPEIPNYSCLQNSWLGGHCPQIPVLSVLSWICWTPPPPNKIPGYATANSDYFSIQH